MTRTKTSANSTIPRLLNHRRVRRFDHHGVPHYAAVDLVAVLARTTRPHAVWEQITRTEPAVREIVQFAQPDGQWPVEVLDRAGVLRLVQLVPGRRAARLRQWLARTAEQFLAEQANPELALLRARRSYVRRGRSLRWIDKRFRAARSRQELTSEWARRGAVEGEDYRALTNELFLHAFGKDVQAYRAEKQATEGFAAGGLRDLMNEEELLLTTLGESLATNVTRRRDSAGMNQLLEDARHAGDIVAMVREELRKPRTPVAVAA
jgi:hypothetical protein